MKKYPPFALFFILLLVTGLVGCGKAEHAPRPGEYGQKMVKSMRLSSSQIDALNASSMPKPDMNDSALETAIDFKAQQKDNPYRFVIVTRGKAISNGEVELRWFGGVASEVSNGMVPESYTEEDSSSYDAGDPVLLINSSEPFSVSKKEFDVVYLAQAQLSKRENIEFSGVELQIWQGKASKFSFARYLWLFAVVLMVLVGIYRVLTLSNRR